MQFQYSSKCMGKKHLQEDARCSASEAKQEGENSPDSNFANFYFLKNCLPFFQISERAQSYAEVLARDDSFQHEQSQSQELGENLGQSTNGSVSTSTLIGIGLEIIVLLQVPPLPAGHHVQGEGGLQARVVRAGASQCTEWHFC